MIKFKKAISFVLVSALIFSLFSTSGSAASKKNYLLIGDSITYGQGIVNSSEACYGKIVANTNNYTYTNDAISGITSLILLSMLSDELYINDVKAADIITISIGGNDILTQNWIWMAAKGLLFKDFKQFDEITKNLAVNFEGIIKKIKSYNPKATIIVQTIYNPNNGIFNGIYQEGVDRLNSVFRNYAKNNPGSIVIAEVEGVISGHKEYIAADTIHPNGKGNIAIAEYMLKLLKNLKLGSNLEPVILSEPIEITGFGISYWINILLYSLDFVDRIVDVI